MRLISYLSIALVALLFSVLTAHADQPGGYPYPQTYPQPQPNLPIPIDQYSPEQTIYCPPGIQMAPPVLPYPGPQVRVVPMTRAYSAPCRWIQRYGYGPDEIWIDGVPAPAYVGFGGNARAVLNNYLATGVCSAVYP